MTDWEKVIRGLECCKAENCSECPYEDTSAPVGKFGTDELVACQPVLYADALELLKAQEKKWIPFVKRPLTEEEKRNHPGWCFILDGEVPDDEQEILLYRPWKNKDGYIIEMDRYMDNGDTVYLEGAMDIENGMYWMPLPEPPKEDT